MLGSSKYIEFESDSMALALYDINNKRYFQDYELHSVVYNSNTKKYVFVLQLKKG